MSSLCLLALFKLSLVHNVSAILKFVLTSLPESAKLIIDDPDEKQHVSALLQALKKEADTLKRHCALPSHAITPALLEEIVCLQCDTDGIASTLKRGWS